MYKHFCGLQNVIVSMFKSSYDISTFFPTQHFNKK